MHRRILIAILWPAALLAADLNAQDAPQRDAFVEDLLSKMSVEEKVGQMTQLTIDPVSSAVQTDSTQHELDIEKLREALTEYHIGSFLNVYSASYSLEHWISLIKTMQDIAVDETRHGIPVIYGIDAVHGHHYMQEGTVFPQNMALAATWNTELVRLSNEVTAMEMRASGIPWNFAPVLDIGRQPLWSRFFETFGEDVHMATEMGLASVAGLQGDDMGSRGRVAACAKHFLGYSLPLSGKDRTPAWIPERMLREYVLPPYVQAIEAGAGTIMINSSEINGVPVHASKEILTDLLRDELGFEGVAVTDWADIVKLHTVHRVAESNREAVRIAVEAGVDMSMVPYDYSFNEDLVALVNDGVISEERIDLSVRRILRLKYDLGLFENPYADATLFDSVGTATSHAISRDAAREAVTLLKNERDLLPLTGNETVLVTGYGAASLAAFHGSWTYTWQGQDENVYPEGLPTVVDVLVDKLGIEQVTYVPGTEETEEVSISAAVEEAFRADIAVVVVAETPTVEKPGDIEDLDLPKVQQDLVKAIAATGTPIVLVIASNRPRIIRELEPLSRAILHAYQTGPYGPEAVVDVVYGDVNPSGRLPFTYPRYTGSLVLHDHKYAEKGDIYYGWDGYQPQWDFAHGLSYTTFEYSNLVIDDTTLTAGDTLKVSVSLDNAGDMPGKEAIGVFVTDEYASITPPVRRLRAFTKVDLEPGENHTARFSIPVSELAFVGLDNTWTIEPGRFRVAIGDQETTFLVE